MLFPVNDYHHERDANSREQITGSSGREVVLGLTVENGSVAASSGASSLYCAWKLGFRQPVVVPLSPLPAVPMSAWPIPSVEAHATPTVEPPQPQSLQNGPDSGTLEQAAASMFSPQPGASAPEPLSANGLAPDPKYPPMPNGNVPMHFQPTGVPYCGGDSVYPPAQVHFYPAHPYQYEFHYHTPPQATPFFTSPPHQDAPGLQAPVQIHSQPSAQPQQSPQAQHRHSDSFNAAMSAQQSAPPNPTLTYDAFWSSHSQSTHSYRNVMYNPPGPTYQGQMNGVYLTANAVPGVADASGLPVSAPMTTAGLPEMAGAPAHATPSAYNF